MSPPWTCPSSLSLWERVRVRGVMILLNEDAARFVQEKVAPKPGIVHRKVLAMHGGSGCRGF